MVKHVHGVDDCVHVYEDVYCLNALEPMVSIFKLSEIFISQHFQDS